MTTDRATLAVETQGLSKTFAGGVRAVDGLDLGLEVGKVHGLVGRNGAGKTTTLRLLLGLLYPSGGRARVLGESPWSASLQTRQRRTYVAQDSGLPGWLAIEDLFAWYATLFPRWDGARARDIAARLEIPRGRTVGTFSGGQKRLAAVTLAFAARPDLLLLDEPAAGLDPISRRGVLDALIELLGEGDGLTVLFSTHILADLERLADTAVFIDRGRCVLLRSVAELEETVRRVQVVFAEPSVPEGFTIRGARRLEIAGPVCTATLLDFREEMLAPVRALPGVRVETFPLGLEDIFLEIVGPPARNGGTGTANPKEVKA